MRSPDPDEAPGTPSRRAALEALPEGGTLLDVGAGAGAASLPLAVERRTAALVAVDQSESMLAGLAARAAELDLVADTVVGGWPDAAGRVGPADVVVCHHVFYNVADLVPFAQALTSHARNRVVVELTATHPLTGQAALWRHFHGIDRPTGPVADDAVAVLRELGLAVESEPFVGPARERSRADWVASVRRRLCLGPERDAEIDALLPPDHEAGPREAVTMWWPGTAPAVGGQE